MCVVTEKHGRDAAATSKGPAGLNIIVRTRVQTFMGFASVNHLYSSRGELDNQVNCPTHILLKAKCHTCKIGLCSTRIRLPDCQPGCTRRAHVAAGAPPAARAVAALASSAAATAGLIFFPSL